MMRMAWALLYVEAIKLRLSTAVKLTVLAPAVLLILQFALLWPQRFDNWNLEPHRVWPPLAIWEYVSRQASLMWAGLVTPILIALDAAYLANMEHARNQWKQLFACPIPRWGVYAVKNCFCGLLVMASFAFFSIGLVALALSVGSLRGVNLVSAIPWTGFLVAMSKACVASWLAIVIQSWLSARLPGFIAPVGIGLAAMIVGIILTNHHMGGWFPWSLPSCSLPQGGYGPVPLAPLLGSVGGLALGVLSCWDLNRRAIV